MQSTEISRHPKSTKLSLYVQNPTQAQTQCLFSCLHAKDKYNYNTRSATHNLLDIPLTKTNMYGENSIKNHCIRDWNNLKKDLSDIPDSEFSLSKIKSYLKQKYFGQY